MNVAIRQPVAIAHAMSAGCGARGGGRGGRSGGRCPAQATGTGGDLLAADAQLLRELGERADRGHRDARRQRRDGRGPRRTRPWYEGPQQGYVLFCLTIACVHICGWCVSGCVVLCGCALGANGVWCSSLGTVGSYCVVAITCTHSCTNTHAHPHPHMQGSVHAVYT